MFDPTIGRWLTEDPIEFEGGDTNLYRYVGNSPTNFTDPTGLAGKTVSSGVKGVEFFIEWFPEKNTGELKILTKKTEAAIVKWMVNRKSGEVTCNIVERHGGRVLPGVAQSTLKRIMPKLTEEMAKNVQRIGGNWVLTRLANRTITGGRVGIGRSAAPAKTGRFGLGMLFGGIMAFFTMENTCQAAEIERPIYVDLGFGQLGLTKEEVMGLSGYFDGLRDAAQHDRIPASN